MNQIPSFIVDLFRCQTEKINKLLRVLEYRRDIYWHSVETAKYTYILARELNLPDEELKQVVLGGLFHDLGKARIDPGLLSRVVLKPDDWEIIRKHPVWSYEMVLEAGLDLETALLVFHHHERMDGQGYPEGIAGNDIPLGSRIITLADSFSAMTIYRNYAGCRTITGALWEISIHAGTQFDSYLVEVMTDLFRQKLREVLVILAV
ncbi:MAG: HD-GYP domain-containing protein [Bacillota bacterium]